MHAPTAIQPVTAIIRNTGTKFAIHKSGKAYFCIYFFQMPVFRIHQPGEHSLLGLWQISESAPELLDLAELSGEDAALFCSIRNTVRQKHWLAWRALLKHMMPGQPLHLHYDEHGKPFPDGYGYRLSVSHSGDFAGCLIHQTQPAGLDIEEIRPRVCKVTERFLSETELKHFGTNAGPFVYTILWAAKEAVYKYQGRSGFDFRNQIQIVPFDPGSEGRLTARLKINNTAVSLPLSYETIQNNYILVYTDS